MLCEDCGRNRAVVHITQIGPDGKIEKNLCERCAAKYGEFLMENQKHRNVSMNDFLKGVFSAGAQGEKPQQEKARSAAASATRRSAASSSRYCAASTGRARTAARSRTARAARLR